MTEKVWIAVALAVFALPLSLLFSTLTFALRDISRSKLAEELGRRRRDDYFDSTLRDAHEMGFVTGSARLLANMVVLIGLIEACESLGLQFWLEYLVAMTVGVVLLVIFALALPGSLASHHGESWIARWVGTIHALHRAARPAVQLLLATERIVSKTSGGSVDEPVESEAQAEETLLEAVEEAESAGAVDEDERQLIENVIDFGDATVEDVMTQRKDIIALEKGSSIEQIIHVVVDSAHSRIPVYRDSIDHIEGVLYARDLLTHWNATRGFNIASVVRVPMFVPRTKRLAELLRDFRHQKVHVAIVVDEYGGTAGLVTIEDVLEELVGDIADEHEPTEPAMFTRVSDRTAEVDAGIEISALNQQLGVALPEDERYSTVAGLLATHLARIPARGDQLSVDRVTLTVIEAEPTRARRARIELRDESEAAPENA
jgi:CBS domain containing-hemolysin-like protein